MALLMATGNSKQTSVVNKSVLYEKMTGEDAPFSSSLAVDPSNNTYYRQQCVAEERRVRDASCQRDANDGEQRDELAEPFP